VTVTNTYQAWDIFDCSGSDDGTPQIQRDDARGLVGIGFASDPEAWRHVALAALAGRDRELRALSIVRHHNRPEFDRIVNQIGATRP